MEELLELLNDIKEDVDFENEKALVDDHILDSFDILDIYITCFHCISHQRKVPIFIFQINPRQCPA